MFRTLSRKILGCDLPFFIPSMKVRSVLHQFVSNSFLTLIDCTKPLGMENGEIRDDQITASSI